LKRRRSATLCKLSARSTEWLRQPVEGTGKPEPLKGDLAGFRSRRVDRTHRLVGGVTATALEVAQCRHHY
jgi:toxin YoeB